MSEEHHCLSCGHSQVWWNAMSGKCDSPIFVAQAARKWNAGWTQGQIPDGTGGDFLVLCPCRELRLVPR